MSIESRLSNERLNVKRLSVEQPAAHEELPFDQERDLPSFEEVERMIDEWIKSGHSQNLINIFELQAEEKVLFPDEVSLDESEQRRLLRLIKGYQKNQNWPQFLRAAVAARRLLPTIDSETYMNEGTWESLKEDCLKDRNSALFSAFFRKASMLKMISPKRVADLDLEATRQQSLEALSKLRSNPAKAMTHWTYVKILYPELKKELRPTASELDIMKAVPGEWRNDALNFLPAAADLKILAAEEVKVTDSGVELIMHTPKLHTAQPPAPTTRKF